MVPSAKDISYISPLSISFLQEQYEQLVLENRLWAIRQLHIVLYFHFPI